uniref:Uncharacterized protein n=1 Tax=Amphimedon queenslandica TaxID=400682 RepID=A0A1X7UQI4_AMPQE
MLCAKWTVGLSQTFFGSKVVEFMDTMTPPKLKINGRLYSITSPVIDGLVYLNLAVLLSVVILLLSYSNCTTFDLDYCTAYSDCYFTEDSGDTFKPFFNCSLPKDIEIDFEDTYYVCFDVLFEPIKIISLLGGFLYIVPPLLFQIFDFIYVRIFFNRLCCRRLTTGKTRMCIVIVVVIQSLIYIVYAICNGLFGTLDYPLSYQAMVAMEKYQIDSWTPLVMAFFCYPQGLFTFYDDITANYQQLQPPQNGTNRQQQAQRNATNRQQQMQQNGTNRQQQTQQNRNRSNRQPIAGQQLNNLDLQLPVQQRDNNIPLTRNNTRSGYGIQQNI